VTEATTPIPPLPAMGRDGRWEKIGEVCVDGCSVMIVDPAYVEHFNDATERHQVGGLYQYFDQLGVEFLPGFGDGGYAVWAWIADYAKAGEPQDERIGQIIMVLIDDDDLAAWHSH
jgi:hypothetical protein